MSEIKVNKITPRTNCGTTQLGDSGDTFTVPAGATISNLGTATGFGGTGVVSWDTASIKTTGFTAVTGTGYFCNTTGGPFTVTLPLSPSAGDVVGVSDYAQTWDSDNLTLGRNSENIGGVAANATLSTEGLAVTLVYVDSTKGWIVTDSGLQTDASTALYVNGTGGCVTTCGSFKTHVFTSPGTLCISSAGNASGSNKIDYLVVAGGGSAGGYYGAGGAGGFRLANCNGLAGMSPLVAACGGLPVAVTGYPVVVGAGGTAHPCAPGVGAYKGNNGTPSVFTGSSTITAAGGGYGSAEPTPTPTSSGGPGGSGGSSGYVGGVPGYGTGNTPPVSPPQGNPGGRRSYATAGGGGGAGAAGSDATCNGSVTCSPAGGPQLGGDGGAGSYVADGFIGPTSGCYGTPGPVGSSRYFAGGGGGGACQAPAPNQAGSGGVGGGADGQKNPGPFGPAQNGTINTGGGGGGSGGGLGGSGIVIIRYKYQA